MISVVTIAYNEAPYIGEAIESVLNQSFKNFEYIVMDDGSDDKTADIMQQMAEKDERIRWFPRGHRGKNATLNDAVSQVQGDWVVLLAGDDIMEPGILKKWADVCKSYDPLENKVALVSRMRMFSHESAYEKYNGLEIPSRSDKVCQSGAAWLASRAVIEELFPIPVGFPNEDGWIALYFEFLLPTTIPVYEICINYRIHGGNSIKKDVPYDQFKSQYHARALAPQVFLNANRAALTPEQIEELECRAALERMRHEEQSMKILFAKGVSIKEKVRAFALSNRTLYGIKIKLNSLLMGH